MKCSSTLLYPSTEGGGRIRRCRPFLGTLPLQPYHHPPPTFSWLCITRWARCSFVFHWTRTMCMSSWLTQILEQFQSTCSCLSLSAANMLSGELCSWCFGKGQWHIEGTAREGSEKMVSTQCLSEKGNLTCSAWRKERHLRDLREWSRIHWDNSQLFSLAERTALWGDSLKFF